MPKLLAFTKCIILGQSAKSYGGFSEKRHAVVRDLPSIRL